MFSDVGGLPPDLIADLQKEIYDPFLRDGPRRSSYEEFSMSKHRKDAAPPVEREALSIVEFCAAHNICRASFYNLLRAGTGPRVMRVGRRTLISVTAAREWRERLEQGVA